MDGVLAGWSSGVSPWESPQAATAIIMANAAAIQASSRTARAGVVPNDLSRETSSAILSSPLLEAPAAFDHRVRSPRNHNLFRASAPAPDARPYELVAD